MDVQTQPDDTTRRSAPARWSGPRTAALRKLQTTFAHVGLQILGPSRPVLDRTAELLAGATQHVIDDARNLQRAGQDTAALVGTLDAEQRLGHLVNAQSVVLRFAINTPGHTRRILLGGDFQFARVGSSDSALTAERDRLLKAIAKEAPYSFAKLSHHGSDNAVGPDFLDALGHTDVLGISCGRGHPAHPDPDTLNLLTQRHGTTWIAPIGPATSPSALKTTGVSIAPAGATNNAEPNAPDAAMVGAVGHGGSPAAFVSPCLVTRWPGG